jgi:nicotinate-nucleotide adenylyltransferase
MIGVYGGTFDPVHYGHLRTALEITEIYALDKMLLIPCSTPPHREQPSVSANMRVQMLQAAVNEHSEFIVDTREVDRPGPSYMVDTLASIRAESGPAPLLLCIGADAFEKLPSWHQWQRLFDFAHVLVMTRPGWKKNTLSEFFKDKLTTRKEELTTAAYGRLIFQNVSKLDISASRIRQIIGEGRKPDFLLPAAVIEVIKKHRFYC